MGKKLKSKFGHASWRVATREVEAFVTETGGQLGPVTFFLRGEKIQPFSIAPWAEEKSDPAWPPVLEALRGDFFCLPFGGNATPFKGERHPVHGETANRRWQLEAATTESLHLSLTTKIRAGRVDKYLSLRPGQMAVYQRHVISGMTGPMNFGNHAMLKFPDHPGSGLVSTSRFRHGEVAPLPLEDPATGGYSCLRAGGKFRSLTKVPLANGGFTDLSNYPARRGFEDIVLLASDHRQPFAWTAVTFPAEGYVWFALKDPRVLRHTIFWMSNGGRHYPPWNGRHVNVLGLEEVTAYFHYGLAESVRPNHLSAKGHATSHQLNPKQPLVVNYIMALAPILKGFDRVVEIIPAADAQSVWLVASSGHKIRVALDLASLGIEMLNTFKQKSSVLSGSAKQSAG
jgi:hypothetical protein